MSVPALQGKYGRAVNVNQQAIEFVERTNGPDDPDLAVLLSNRATILREQVGFGCPVSRGFEAVREVVTVTGSFLIEADVPCWCHRGVPRQGECDEADSGYLRAIRILERVKGHSCPDLAWVLSNWATLLQQQVKLFSLRQAHRGRAFSRVYFNAAGEMLTW